MMKNIQYIVLALQTGVGLIMAFDKINFQPLKGTSKLCFFLTPFRGWGKTKKSIVWNIVGFVAYSLFMMSCEVETNWNIQPSKTLVIIDGIITNENKAQEIKIYTSSPNFNEASIPISGAKVMVSDGNRNYNFQESETTPGLYRSEPFVAATGINYALIVEHNGNNDTAFAVMFPVSPLKGYKFEPKDSLLKYVYTGSDLPAMTEIYYNWSADTAYCSAYGNCLASETHYTIHIVDAAKEFAPAKQKILFPRGTSIVRKKYSLSDKHQNFIRSLLIETEWRGGIFDMEHGNVPTNFRNGAKGWFAVCQVLSDSITIMY